MGQKNNMKPGTLIYDNEDKEYGIVIKWVPTGESSLDKNVDNLSIYDGYDVFWFRLGIIHTGIEYIKHDCICVYTPKE